MEFVTGKHPEDESSLYRVASPGKEKIDSFAFLALSLRPINDCMPAFMVLR